MNTVIELAKSTPDFIKGHKDGIQHADKSCKVVAGVGTLFAFLGINHPLVRLAKGASNLRTLTYGALMIHHATELGETIVGKTERSAGKFLELGNAVAFELCLLGAGTLKHFKVTQHGAAIFAAPINILVLGLDSQGLIGTVRNPKGFSETALAITDDCGDGLATLADMFDRSGVVSATLTIGSGLANIAKRTFYR